MPIYEYACTSCGEATRPVLSVTAVLGSSGKALPLASQCDAGPACCGGGCHVH